MTQKLQGPHQRGEIHKRKQESKKTRKKERKQELDQESIKKKKIFFFFSFVAFLFSHFPVFFYKFPPQCLERTCG